MITLSDSLIPDVKYKHFIDYTKYSEIKLQWEPDEEGYCYRCKKELEPLTYLEPEFYYQPCWECTSKRRTSRLLLTEGLQRGMREFYNKILGDRYLQLFIVDDIYFNNTLPHNYETFKRVISLLDPPSRNDIWFLDWSPGFPKIISTENLAGLKIVNLTKFYEPIDFGKDSDIVRVGEFEILMPEPSTFDIKHHSRYSVLNNSKAARKNKRFKVGNRCVKFYSTEDETVNAIFRIKKNGEDITARNLTYQEFVIIKLAIMRNKNFMRLIFDIVLEISKFVSFVRDSVFLKNTVYFSPEQEIEKDKAGMTLLWTALSEHKDPNLINISII